MSRELSVHVSTSGASFADVIDVLLSSGWEVRDVTGTSYVPAAAEDFDWMMFSSETGEYALAESRKRDAAGLTPALVLLRRGEIRGGQFIWLEGRTLVAAMNVNLVDDFDFATPVEEVARPLVAAGINVERVVVERI